MRQEREKKRTWRLGDLNGDRKRHRDKKREIHEVKKRNSLTSSRQRMG